MAMNRLRLYLEGLRRRQRERRMAIALNCDLLAAAAKMKDRRPLHEDVGLVLFDYCDIPSVTVAATILK
jgi:hypothetical protein